MLKIICVAVLALMLAACNLTAEPEQDSSPSPTTLATSEAPTQMVTGTNIIPTTRSQQSSATPIPLPQFSTSAGNNSNLSSTDTPAPIGVRPPTQQQANTPIQPTIAVSATTVTATESDIPFPKEFNDHYEINAGQGRTLYVTYEVVVNNPGAGYVFIEIRDPNGEPIGQLVLGETASDEYEVTTRTGGAHQLLVTSRNLRGFYSVSYGTR